MAKCEAWAVARGKDGDGAKVRHIVAYTIQYSSVSIQCRLHQEERIQNLLMRDAHWSQLQT